MIRFLASPFPLTLWLRQVPHKHELCREPPRKSQSIVRHNGNVLHCAREMDDKFLLFTKPWSKATFSSVDPQKSAETDIVHHCTKRAKPLWWKGFMECLLPASYLWNHSSDQTQVLHDLPTTGLLLLHISEMIRNYLRRHYFQSKFKRTAWDAILHSKFTIPHDSIRATHTIQEKATLRNLTVS